MCFLVHAQTGRNKISETFPIVSNKDVTTSMQRLQDSYFSDKNVEADRNKVGH